MLLLRFGLRLADGTIEPMMCATSELVREGITATQSGASKILHRLEGYGTVWSPGCMPPIKGKPSGTRMFLPGPRPDGPEPDGGWVVRGRLDLVPGAVFEPGAIPVEAEHVGTGGAPAEPAAEVPDQPGVADAVGRPAAFPLDGAVTCERGAEAVISVHDDGAYADVSTPRPTPSVLAGLASQRAVGGQRNDTGLWLACQLRDNGFSEGDAVGAMLDYQRAVGGLGDHPYTVGEAWKTMRSAYGRPPRDP